jgi:hypothetical protein
MREQLTPERELNDTKQQLARLAYDIFNLRLTGTKVVDQLHFSELSDDYKIAWIEAIWSAIEASKNKKLVLTDKITKKEEDNGYFIYMHCKEIKKSHPDLFTYSKFPEHVKEMYRELAKTIYEKIDMEEEE